MSDNIPITAGTGRAKANRDRPSFDRTTGHHPVNHGASTRADLFHEGEVGQLDRVAVRRDQRSAGVDPVARGTAFHDLDQAEAHGPRRHLRTQILLERSACVPGCFEPLGSELIRWESRYFASQMTLGLNQIGQQNFTPNRGPELRWATAERGRPLLSIERTRAER